MGARGGALGVQRCCGGAVEDAGAHRPVHGRLRVAGDLVTVRVLPDGHAALGGVVAHELGEPVQQGRQLLAGDGGAGRGAVGDAILHRPGPGRRHAGGVSAGEPGQDHPHLLAGDAGAGAEAAGTGAVDVPVLVGPGDGVRRPEVLRHIGEGQVRRLGDGGEGDLDGHFPHRLGEAIGAVPVGGDFHRPAVPVGDRDGVHLIAPVGIRGDGDLVAGLGRPGADPDGAAVRDVQGGRVAGAGAAGIAGKFGGQAAVRGQGEGIAGAGADLCAALRPAHKVIAAAGGGRHGDGGALFKRAAAADSAAAFGGDGHGVELRPLGVIGFVPRVGGGDRRHRFARQLCVVIPPAKPVACVGHILRRGERRAHAVGVLGHVAAVDGAAVGVQRHFVGACLPLGVIGLFSRVGGGDRRHRFAGEVAALVPARECVARAGHIGRQRRAHAVGVPGHVAAVNGAAAGVQRHLVGERRPLGIEGRRGGHGVTSKIPCRIQTAVAVPPVKPVACFGWGCRRLGRGAAVGDKLHGDRPCPAIGIKGNRIERGALAALAAVRIGAAARGGDGKGVAARLGDLEVLGRAACGNRVALGAAVLVELDGVAGSACNRAPCGLAGGGGTPCKPRWGGKRLADGKFLCRFCRRIPTCICRRHFHPINAGGRGSGSKHVANRSIVVLMPCNGDGRYRRISGVGVAAVVQGHGVTIMGLIQICTNGNGRRQFWRNGAASGNGNIVRPGSTLRQGQACSVWNVDCDTVGECHALRQSHITAVDRVIAIFGGPDAATVVAFGAAATKAAADVVAGSAAARAVALAASDGNIISEDDDRTAGTAGTGACTAADAGSPIAAITNASATSDGDGAAGDHDSTAAAGAIKGRRAVASADARRAAAIVSTSTTAASYGDDTSGNIDRTATTAVTHTGTAANSRSGERARPSDNGNVTADNADATARLSLTLIGTVTADPCSATPVICGSSTCNTEFPATTIFGALMRAVSSCGSTLDG